MNIFSFELCSCLERYWQTYATCYFPQPNEYIFNSISEVNIVHHIVWALELNKIELKLQLPHL